MLRVPFGVNFVTPCFLGGAGLEPVAEWRAASIRGQLRSWFRAVANAKLGGDLGEIRRLEETLFGSTLRRSGIAITTGPIEKTANVAAGATEFRPPHDATDAATANGLAYLGYGPIGRDGGRVTNVRPYLAPGKTTSFDILFRDNRLAAGGEATSLLMFAIYCWSHFGGLGSRSRRGYGSLEISGPSDFPIMSRRGLVRNLKKAFQLRFESRSGDATVQLPKFTAWSPATRIFEWADALPTWQHALQEVGATLIGFRHRYRQGKLDYEWAWMGTELHIPHRVGFGLPLGFGQSCVLEGAVHDRRASPLFIHIAKEKDAFRPVLLYLPSVFLPDIEEDNQWHAEPVIYKHPPGSHRPAGGAREAVSAEQYRVVDSYLDHICDTRVAVEIESDFTKKATR